MKNNFFAILSSVAIAFCVPNTLVYGQTTADFEGLNLPTNSYWDGSAAPNGTSFANGNAIFPNNYNGAFGYWESGWAYSNKKDSITAGFGALFNAVTASGYGGSNNYIVGQQGSVIRLNTTAIGKGINGFYVTNTSYAALSMRNGDSFAKKFGGTTGNDPDFFKIIIKKWLNGSIGTDSVEVFLADFRSANNAQDYILKTWKWVDTAPLGNADSLSFELKSSDVGGFGINTPTFFCIDNFITKDAFVTVDNQYNNESNIRIFPNPSSDKLTVYTATPLEGTTQITITDLTGKVLQTVLSSNTDTILLHIADFPSGVYLINIVNQGVITTKKMVKQ